MTRSCGSEFIAWGAVTFLLCLIANDIEENWPLTHAPWLEMREIFYMYEYIFIHLYCIKECHDTQVF